MQGMEDVTDLDIISTEEAEKASITELLRKLSCSEKGLSTSEAEERIQKYGYNEITEKKAHPLLKFLSYFWGPIPWMIEVAAVLSVLIRHWDDFSIIMALLFFNAGIGFWQEHKAANALEALKEQLALKARVLRDGKWQELVAEKLVPGDVTRIQLGDVIPADVKLIEGDYIDIDQSALTGESLLVSKKIGDVAYSGSVAKQGEMVALVTSTGSNTYFGRTAKLVESAAPISHFQRAVLTIGDFLIYMSLGLAAMLILVQLSRGAPVLELVQFALVLIVASIPVAMPAVLSMTMAVGALALSRMKAIVSRLQSIEEMAGIDILCSDKTGTLTQNKLTLGDPVTFEAKDVQELILTGALASEAENPDAIDRAVMGGLKDQEALSSYQQLKIVPFDPVHKRTEATIKDSGGNVFKVTKGAPQVILSISQIDPSSKTRAEEIVNEFAAKGFRTLGVAKADEGGAWRFLGILPLYDPPREDSAETIARAQAHGVQFKMVTGDNVAIARHISEQLGMGKNIQPAGQLFKKDVDAGHLSSQAAMQIEQADGFAQVYPEHKYGIVKALQARGHIVGMTGDGVNDSPALKQADAGIAVSGATDAARAAASLVLTAPGLSVIINAIEEARKIFERMNSYAIYRITETIRIMFFVVLAMIAYNFYPITAIMIILLAFFNDIPIMTIAFDNTVLDPKPVHWDMHRILTLSAVLGLIGVVETFGILIIAKDWLFLGVTQIQTFIFLKLAVAGHLTLFVARTRRPFFTKPYPSQLVLWSAIGTKLLATLFVVYPFGLITPISWINVALIWVYCLVWIFIEDIAKLGVYRHLELKTPRHRNFLRFIKQPVTHYAAWCHRKGAWKE